MTVGQFIALVLLLPQNIFTFQTTVHFLPRKPCVILGATTRRWGEMKNGEFSNASKKRTRQCLHDPTQDDDASTSSSNNVQVSFSHIHLFVDRLEDISVYKALERKLNQLSYQMNGKVNVEMGRTLWRQLHSTSSHEDLDSSRIITNESFDFLPQNRDVVKQMLAGLGFRITAIRYPSSNSSNHENIATRSVLITSKDPGGVKIIVTAPDQNGIVDGAALQLHHFHSNELEQFLQNNSNRQGIAVLAFEVTDGDIEDVYKKYLNFHPSLISSLLSYRVDGSSDCSTKVLEVYAYYKNEKADMQVDKATKLRFIQKIDARPNTGDSNDDKASKIYPYFLPGLVPVDAIFDDTSMPAYFDHWVSNVMSRTSFIETMTDVLGFNPKVDFNAGVVAAGEAQIESTVIGNDSLFRTMMKELALKDQSQVFLPINNALSDVGHVHGFLQEIGQGIQHIASRVHDLASFVQRGNDFRDITGEGFTFLKIPRSYYGVLTTNVLMAGMTEEGKSISLDCASSIVNTCCATGIAAPDGAVDLDMTPEIINRQLDNFLPPDARNEYQNQKEIIIDIIMRSRYLNLRNLLGNSFDDQKYLSLVRNQILVDVQRDDLLLQIFTSNILQRKAGEEAPFFEYIERVCSESSNTDGSKRRIRPGCGGFGIRNFLTLFLSIEVSKAMMEVSRAHSVGDVERKAYSQKMVDIFTEQLNESNPILNEISDAMKDEGLALIDLNAAIASNNYDAIPSLKKRCEIASLAKKAGNEKLMECSTKYKNLMRSLRLSNIISPILQLDVK